MALSMFNDLLSSIADRGRSIVGLSNSNNRMTIATDVAELCYKVLSNPGEATGIALSLEVLTRYSQLPGDEKTKFFLLLANEFSASRQAVQAAAEKYLAEPTQMSLIELANATRPPRTELIMRLNQAPEAMKALVAMRSDLLDRIPSNPELQFVDRDFTELFTSWFNRGFLELRKIDWNTPAAILERIIRYEAVHGMSDWNDLRHRIDPPDRDIYGFFHPRLGDEPLIFVEVALMEKMPARIDQILSSARNVISANTAKTAVFYSISNCQSGLRGIPLGNFLIKQVVESLRRTFPNLKEFVTLSPVPSLAEWFANIAHEDVQLPAETIKAFSDMSANTGLSDKDRRVRYERHILPAAAWYIGRIKNDAGKPRDPVARFHIGNGARLERINWAGDLSEKALATSLGLMVNYKYRLDQIERNHEQYASSGLVSTSAATGKKIGTFENEVRSAKSSLPETKTPAHDERHGSAAA